MNLRRVALTGGIATGKSYCLARFARLGVPVIDADILAHAVVRRGEPAWDAVRERFGDAVIQANGEIDRARLGGIIFGNAEARRDLEAIVHPAVYDTVKAWYESLAGAAPGFAMADIPLLFETNHAADFHSVVATWCPEEMQVERLRERNGLTEEQARIRLAAQLHTDEKARRADYVIKTDGTFADTNRQVDEVFQALRG